MCSPEYCCCLEEYSDSYIYFYWLAVVAEPVFVGVVGAAADSKAVDSD